MRPSLSNHPSSANLAGRMMPCEITFASRILILKLRSIPIVPHPMSRKEAQRSFGSSVELSRLAADAVRPNLI
jgi:hypothetical protein